MVNPLQLTFEFISDLVRPRAEPAVPPPLPAGPQIPRAIEAEQPAAIAVELRRSARRHSLSLEVHPDLRVIVRAPLRCSERELAGFVAERRRWIETQLEYFRRQPPPALAPAYAEDASHLYLGRPYRLRLLPLAPLDVRIVDDCLLISGRAARTAVAVKRALAAWYRERATVEFSAILDACHDHPRFCRYPRPSLQIRAMRTRWGSLGPRRGMTLNLILIEAPAACIEYVVMHELCHLRYRGHGKGFYRLFDSVLPDWRERKRLLEDTIR